MLYSDSLKERSPFSLPKRRLKTQCMSTVRERQIARMNRLFNLVKKDLTKTRSWKLKPDKFKLEIKHWVFLK